ncbi:MAG: BatA and WFA domain-containing protein [Lachnospiraceae bacterium]|nr:BatA and WFA domain-containing protein [Lachnospiraceae bacterium]
MKFLYLWPFFLLLLIPVIIIMYLLKQKAVDMPIASLFLWKEMYRNVEANTPWEKLKKNWLFILQIITVIVLIIALASPYIMSGSAGADHAIIVIDNSASMNAVYEGEHTRLEQAINEAEDYVRSLKTGTGISIITSNAKATLVLSNSDDKTQAINELKSIEPGYVAGDCAAGIEMVKSMQTQWDSVETVCFTDTAVSMEQVEGYIVDLYIPVNNTSVDYVGHGMNNGKLVVLAKVSNYGAEPVTTDATLYGDDELLQIKTVTIQAGEAEVVYFDDVIFEGSALSVELSGQDAIKEDNICYDVLEENKVTKVLLMTESNLYLEKALLLVDGIEITKSNDISSFSDFMTQEYDLYIFDGMAPEVLPAEGNMIFMNVRCEELYETVSPMGGVMVSVENHSLTEYLDELSFGVSSVYALDKPEWAETFLSVGDTCVGFIGKKDVQTVCVMGFDFHNSDLPLKMEFPILIYNIVNECTASGLIGETVVSAGDTVTINGKLNVKLPVVTRPDGSEQELSDYRMNYTNTEDLGVYVVEQHQGTARVERAFAVNFPASESTITNAPSAMITEVNEDAVKTTVGGMLNLRNLIILIALGLLGIEWIAYIRR